MLPCEINAEFRDHEAAAERFPGARSALVNLARYCGKLLAAVDRGDDSAVQYELSVIRSCVATPTSALEQAIRDDVGARSDPDWQARTWRRIRADQGYRWWQPLSRRMCLLLAGLAAFGLAAAVTAVALRLETQDNNVQLHNCQNELQHWSNPSR